MSNHAKRHSFTVFYDGLFDQLVMPVGVLPASAGSKEFTDNYIEIDALWDTGAMVTCIKPSLRDRLGLLPFDTANPAVLAGIGGETTADFSFVTIYFTHAFKMEYCPVYVIELPGDEEMVIGMDIITKGDFAVCNAQCKTSFSFVLPPLSDRIDFGAQKNGV